MNPIEHLSESEIRNRRDILRLHSTLRDVPVHFKPLIVYFEGSVQIDGDRWPFYPGITPIDLGFVMDVKVAHPQQGVGFTVRTTKSMSEMFFPVSKTDNSHLYYEVLTAQQALYGYAAVHTILAEPT